MYRYKGCFIFSRHRQKEECQFVSLLITRIWIWYGCICCHNLILQNSYLTHIPRQVKHWIRSPWCVCDVLCRNPRALLCCRTHMVKAWAGPSRPWDCTSVRRPDRSAAVTLLGPSWDDEGVDQVRHLRAICQHSHQHTLPFSPPQLNNATFAHSFKQPPFVQKNLIDNIFQTWTRLQKLVKFSWLRGRLTPNWERSRFFVLSWVRTLCSSGNNVTAPCCRSARRPWGSAEADKQCDKQCDKRCDKQ